MKHRAVDSYWREYDSLPEHIRELADKAFELMKQDPKHPSLHFKNVGRCWSARVGRHHRALAIQDAEDFVWFWIGDHDEYDRLLKRR